MNTAQEGCRTNPRTYSKAEYDELSVKFAALEAENAKLRAELERLQVDGWKLVPVEPTPGMAKVSTWDMNSFFPASKVWADMLAAAPSAPAAQGGE